jgi:signal transduction histidine kinase
MVVRAAEAAPLAGTAELCEPVVRYVARSHETVVLDEEKRSSLFADDPYLRDRSPKSLVCLPLLHQGSLLGVWYAESDTAGRLRRGLIDLLQMLASQAASALENARLYEQLQQTSEKLSRLNDHLEAEVARRTEELRAASQRVVQLEKDATEVQMAGGFAHEMRNALGSAKAFLAAGYAENGESLFVKNHESLRALFLEFQEAVSEDKLDAIGPLFEELERNGQRFNMIFGNTDQAVGRALRFTKEVLEYSQLNREQPGDEPVLLRPVVESILAEAAADFAKQGIVTQVGITPEYALRGHARHFTSILRHLVSNGRDALVEKEGEGPRELRLEAVEEPERWVIRISDTGVGIAPADRDRIFAPFFSTRPTTGTGLGLSMVEKLVRLYHGLVSFKSEVGRGTTFTLAFPALDGQA